MIGAHTIARKDAMAMAVKKMVCGERGLPSQLAMAPIDTAHNAAGMTVAMLNPKMRNERPR